MKEMIEFTKPGKRKSKKQETWKDMYYEKELKKVRKAERKKTMYKDLEKMRKRADTQVRRERMTSFGRKVDIAGGYASKLKKGLIKTKKEGTSLDKRLGFIVTGKKKGKSWYD